MNSQRLDDALQRLGVDGVLATTYENVVYTSGFSSATGRMYPQIPHWCFVPRSDLGKPVLIMPVPEAGLLADQGRDPATVCLFGKPTEHLVEGVALDGADVPLLEMSRQAAGGVLDAVMRACSTAGIKSGKVAVDCSQGNAALSMLAAASHGIEWTANGESALLWARMVKTSDEKEHMRAAGALNQAAITHAVGVLGKGGGDTDFAQAWRQHVVAAGGEPTFMMAGSARRAGTFRPPAPRVAQTGERFRWDCGLRLNGYCADTGGTVQIRAEPGAAERRLYDAITAGVHLAVNEARPGVKISDLYQSVVGAVRAHGAAQFAHPHVGHGMGVEARDLPTLSPRQPERIAFIEGDFDPVVEAGMVLNVETPLSLLGEGGYQHEVTFWVGDKGNELLTPLHPYYIAQQ